MISVVYTLGVGMHDWVCRVNLYAIYYPYVIESWTYVDESGCAVAFAFKVVVDFAD
jgi:hypothetical protein